MATDLVFAEAGADELPLVAQLAERIWWSVYPPIIGSAQVRYMLERMYASEALQRDRDRGVVFVLARHPAQPRQEAIGFYAVDLSSAPAHAFLDKLYLLPEWHGSGRGQQMLASVWTLACQRGHAGVVLRVNRHNTRAIQAYRRFGFRELGPIRSDIGGGFVMDDLRFVRDCATKLMNGGGTTS